MLTSRRRHATKNRIVLALVFLITLLPLAEARSSSSRSSSTRTTKAHCEAKGQIGIALDGEVRINAPEIVAAGLHAAGPPGSSSRRHTPARLPARPPARARAT